MELNENSYISGPEFPTRRASDSSQTPLTEPMKRPIGNCWYFWYKNESLILLTLVIVNVILILINLPILATVMNRLSDVKDEQTELKKSFLEEQTDLKKSFENQTGLLLVSLGLINIALKEVSSDLNQTGLIKDSFKNQNKTLNHILEHSHKIEDYVNGTIIAHRQIEDNQLVLELKIDEVGCAIGLNSSIMPATNVTGPIEKSVPAATEGNMYFYKVFCKGACNVEIDLLMDNDLHDVDLYASKDMSGYGNETLDTLCTSETFNGMEDCTVTTTSSTFYTKVYAFHSHGIGNLTFTGLNLIYVTDANKTEESVPVLNHNCNQTTNLFKMMDNITKTIDQTLEEQTEMVVMIGNMTKKIDGLKPVTPLQKAIEFEHRTKRKQLP